jgi:hypothetical protein
LVALAAEAAGRWFDIVGYRTGYVIAEARPEGLFWVEGGELPFAPQAVSGKKQGRTTRESAEAGTM